jgi:hypothetical protein
MAVASTSEVRIESVLIEQALNLRGEPKAQGPSLIFLIMAFLILLGVDMNNCAFRDCYSLNVCVSPKFIYSGPNSNFSVRKQKRGPRETLTSLSCEDTAKRHHL